MADILIRGVRMPVACSDCPSRDVSVCVWTDDYNVESYKFSRPSFCPLHELPEHGDLIDRDALIKTCNEIIDEDWNAKAAPYSWSYAYESFVDDIVAIPVIVSASKEETE